MVQIASVDNLCDSLYLTPTALSHRDLTPTAHHRVTLAYHTKTHLEILTPLILLHLGPLRQLYIILPISPPSICLTVFLYQNITFSTRLPFHPST